LPSIMRSLTSFQAGSMPSHTLVLKKSTSGFDYPRS
jgi:hypothetical protein